MKGFILVNKNVPWLSRMVCKYLWHSFTGVINEYGVLRWLVCRRCGLQRDLIWGR